jgi:6,7-dimethyl-8-ribityllumazine synthase
VSGKKKFGVRKQHADAVIVIGCVIQGDTPHFDYVCQSVTQGVSLLNALGSGASTGGFNNPNACPVIFSVLTTLDKQQALDRAGGRLGNKGVEGAVTAIKMANLI